MTWACPWCRRAPQSYLYTDGDNLQAMGPMLPVAPSGYYAHYNYGRCENCSGEYIGLTITMFDREMSDGIAQCLWLNEDTAVIAVETLEADVLSWEVTVHETPHGIMLEHDLGPFPKAYVKREGAIYRYPADDTVKFLRDLAIALWPRMIDRLRAG